MASRVSYTTGVIEMERTANRVASYPDRDDERDCASELAHLARGPRYAHRGALDSDADETVYADVEQLAEELDAEYAVVCEIIAYARR